MAINNAAAAFIGASVTLVLVIVFMILMVVLVRQCLAFLAKRSAIRSQVEAQQRARAEFERQRRTSITEPVPATFDWHHSIRIAGTPPPSYREAKRLPPLNDGVLPSKKTKKQSKEKGNGVDGNESDSSEPGGPRGSVVVETNSPQMPSVSYTDFEDSLNVVVQRQDVSIVMEHDRQVNGHIEGDATPLTSMSHDQGRDGPREV